MQLRVPSLPGACVGHQEKPPAKAVAAGSCDEKPHGQPTAERRTFTCLGDDHTEAGAARYLVG